MPSYLDTEDLTASLPSHYINSPPEGRVFVNPIDRIFMPTASPFYTKDLEIYSQPGDVLLTPGVQYKALWMHTDASRRAGKEVCAVIYITDNTVNEITMKYRTIGGDWVNVVGDVVGVLSLPNANEVTWGQIVGVPAQFEPVEHLHHVRNLFGMEELLTMGESLRRALVNDADTPVLAAIYQYIDAKLQSYVKHTDLTSTTAGVTSSINAHKIDPNAHTKDKVGLEFVENLPLALDVDAYSGSNAKYATPSSAVKSMLGALRTVGSSVAFDPNSLAIAPIQLCRHNNCPTGAPGNSAGDRFMVFTGFRVSNVANNNATAEYATQVAFAIDTGSPAITQTTGIYTRFYPAAPGTWSPWARVDQPNSIFLGTSNLNDILTAGGYHQNVPSSATQPRNYPPRCRNQECTLEVFKHPSGSVVQKITNHGPSSGTTAEYIRQYNSNTTTWSTWRTSIDDIFTSGDNVAIGINQTTRSFSIGSGAAFPTNDGTKYIVWNFFRPATHGDELTDATQRHQIAYVAPETETEQQGMFHRFYNGTAPYTGTAWSAWRRMASPTTTDGAVHRYTTASTPNSPDSILDPFFRFTVENAGEGGLGLPVGVWYIQNYFDSADFRQITGHYRTQIAFMQTDFENNRTRAYIRRVGTSGPWCRWMKMDVMGLEALSDTDDLNNFHVDGRYVMFMPYGTMTAQKFEDMHYPINHQGILTVERLWHDSTVNTKTLQTYQSHEGFGVWKRRTRDDTTWSPWYKVQENVPVSFENYSVKQALKRARGLFGIKPANYSTRTHNVNNVSNGSVDTVIASQSAPLLGPDGKIYSVNTVYDYPTTPTTEYQVYDPITDSLEYRSEQTANVTNLNTLGVVQKFGGFAPSAGNYIYLLPGEVIIPSGTGKAYLGAWNLNFKPFDAFNGRFQDFTFDLPSGTHGWTSGCVSLTGAVYCPPSRGSRILKITQSNVISLITGVEDDGNNRYNGAQLALNGKIYCAPSDATKVLIIDPATDTFQETDFGLNLSGSEKYAGILLGSDGRLYCIPYNATDILVIDTDINRAWFLNAGFDASAPASTYAGVAKWWGGCVGPDGNLWFSPRNATAPLVIDTLDDAAITATLVMASSIPAGTNRFGGFAQTPTGQIYGPAHGLSSCFFITPRKAPALGEDVLYSPYYNKAL